MLTTSASLNNMGVNSKSINDLYEELHSFIWQLKEDVNNDYARRQIGILEKEIFEETGFHPTKT